MEWSEEETIFLIDNFKSKRLLWDLRHQDHKTKPITQDAWREITAAFVGKSIVDCKKKIRWLLFTYLGEKSKIKISRSKGNGAHVYVSEWFGYKLLRFLEHSDLSTNGLCAEILDEDMMDIENENDGSPPVAPSITPNANKRKIDEANTSIAKKVCEALNTAGSKPDKQSSEPDETSLFFTFVTKKVKRYSAQTRARIQHAMFGILMNADQGFYDIQHSYYQPATNLVQHNVHYPQIRGTELMFSQTQNYQSQMYAAVENSQPPQMYTTNNFMQQIYPESSMSTSTGFENFM